MSIYVVVFDFDGVFVLDSDAVFKKEAWGIALNRPLPQYEAFLKQGNQLYGNGKPGGRVEILHYIFKQLGKPVEIIPALVTQAAQAFDDHVQQRIREAGLVPGAREMLETLFARHIKLYLNSGTATSALERTARNLGIHHFFSSILGSTKEPCGGSKTENLRYIAMRENAQSYEILFVGDGESDYKAAQEFVCPFVGVANKWNQWLNTPKPFPVITDLLDVLKWGRQLHEPNKWE